jgi:hypothetical protein
MLPPVAGTCHTRFDPSRFELKTIRRPSADHISDPMLWPSEVICRAGPPDIGTV